MEYGTKKAAHVVCPECGAVNRVRADRPPEEARCGQCHRDLFAGKPSAVDGLAFERHIARNDIDVLVDFWAPWCGPCHTMAPSFAAAARALEPRMRLLKVNVDENPQIAARYGVRSIPTLMLFRGGQPRASVAGAMDERRLVAWAEQQVGSAAA